MEYDEQVDLEIQVVPSDMQVGPQAKHLAVVVAIAAVQFVYNEHPA